MVVQVPHLSTKESFLDERESAHIFPTKRSALMNTQTAGTAHSPARATRMAVRNSPAVNSSIRSSPRISRRTSKVDLEGPSAERHLQNVLEACVPSVPASPCMAPVSPRSTAARQPPTPRGARLNVRDNRKEAIATMPALDFVSLSACDREMVQECDDGHAQTELRKRSFCTAGRSPAGGEKRKRSLALDALKSPGLSSAEEEDELGGFQLRLIKLPKQRDAVRPRSSRGADSRCGDSPRGGESPRGGDSLFDGDGSSPRPRLPLAAPPLLRSLRSLHGQPGGPEVRERPPSCTPSSVFGHCPASRPGSALRSVYSSGSRSSLSISGMSTLSSNLASRPSRTSTETPPCSSNAFEAHAMLVRCPAPRRPAVQSRLSQDTRSSSQDMRYSSMDGAHFSDWGSRFEQEGPSLFK